MNTKSLLKLPNLLNLSRIVPGQYGQIILPLKASNVCFLNLQLSNKSVNNGFFLLKQGSNDCKNQINVVLKPGVLINIVVAFYPEEIMKSTTFQGQLFIKEEGSIHTVRLICKVQIPCFLCKKMLEDTEKKQKMIRIIINKAVTNEGKIMLTNMQDYSLEIQAGLLIESTIADKKNPFIIKVNQNIMNVEAQQQFIIFLNVTTNIGFSSKDIKVIKRCVMRNVLTIRTNSVLLWCLPIQIIVVYVKQPEIKE